MLEGHGNLVNSIIQTVRVDEFVKEHQLSPTYLFKISTEKHEVDVLVGFGKIINQFKPVVLIEILDEKLGKVILPFFFEISYVYYEIIKGKEMRRVNSLGASSNNYLICPKELAEINEFGDIVSHEYLNFLFERKARDFSS